jgi:hypothetical protein
MRVKTKQNKTTCTLKQSLAAARDGLGPARAVPMLLGPLTFLWLGHLRPSHPQVCVYICIYTYI